jgi:hypothetical protein
MRSRRQHGVVGVRALNAAPTRAATSRLLASSWSVFVTSWRFTIRTHASLQRLWILHY